MTLRTKGSPSIPARPYPLKNTWDFKGYKKFVPGLKPSLQFSPLCLEGLGYVAVLSVLAALPCMAVRHHARRSNSSNRNSFQRLVAVCSRRPREVN